MRASIIQDARLAPGGSVDREIASIKLETPGVGIDRLTAEQEEQRRRWQ